ncbi:conserved hypothetical protein [Rubrivivax sp. A210]|uniref:universal stress protein n=1 Tax=Rubrivivax sp. A210 TaxID=2772301 RepID=UPI001919A81E|nr:universal stress protein [Rubrivivax sp. A210]CAD5373718.1 conserved hypothetical protein [Rubrivivax sp. A210]
MTTPYSRLLLATEHSEHDRGAETLAFALASHCQLPLAGVLPLLSNPEFEMVAPQRARQAEAEAAARIQSLAARASQAGVALDLRLRRGARLFQEIVAEARERGADLLVIRRRGRRGLLAQLLVGEMVSQVVAHAPCSVLVTPQGSTMWSRRVLLGLDPTAPDAALLRQAAALADACRLPLRAVCVAAAESTRAAAQVALDAAVAQAQALCGQAEGELRIGRPHEQLLAAAQACGADLMVLARERGRPKRGRLGGVAEEVIGHALCPVLVHVNKQGASPP